MCGFIAVFYVVLVFSIAVYNGYNRLYPDGGAAAGGRKPTLAHLRRSAAPPSTHAKLPQPKRPAARPSPKPAGGLEPAVPLDPCWSDGRGLCRVASFRSMDKFHDL